MKQLAELVRDFPSEALQLFQSQRQVLRGTEARAAGGGDRTPDWHSRAIYDGRRTTDNEPVTSDKGLAYAMEK
jgi:hypothetical protein